MGIGTTNQSGGLDLGDVTALQWAGIALAAVTGAIHLVLGVSFLGTPMGWSFLLAGVGFFAGGGAVAVGYRRRLVYLLGLPFTGVQIVAWYLVNAPAFSVLGIADKLAQVGLIAVIVGLYRRESAAR
ncbi:DUF7475 family protein [Halorussus marinus]|uniref:DUF7475 family protein n=1 Tax=Halorussus marinus TaxID=2505976 RepID=UPI001091C64E|nr:hypothetical protein [Halorussus marinus]